MPLIASEDLATTVAEDLGRALGASGGPRTVADHVEEVAADALRQTDESCGRTTAGSRRRAVTGSGTAAGRSVRSRDVARVSDSGLEQPSRTPS